MASNVMASTALFLSFNLLFFTLVSSTNVDSPLNGGGGILDDLSNGGSSNGNNGLVNVNDLLNSGGLVDVELGNVPTKPCCSLIQGLADLEVALCLCTAVRANVLGIINLDLPINLSLLLNNCRRTPALEYMCSP
ncbi:hypothetical protein CRYUN_Cryun41cG0063800 [Craigia yunnanensis]